MPIRQIDGCCTFDISAHVSPKVFLTEEAHRKGIEEDSCMRFDVSWTRSRLDLLRSMGIRAFNTFGNYDIWWDAAEHEPIAAFFTAYLAEYPELRMSSFHYVGSVYEEDPEDRKRMHEQMAATARMFGPCHPGSFVVHPGTFGAGRFKAHLPRYREAVRLHGEKAVMEAVASNIRVLADEAAQFGSRVAIENLYGGRVYSTIDELIELVEMIDRENVGFCLDTGHAHADGVDLPQAVRRMGSRLFELHLHDNRGTDAHLPVGFGTIDWVPFIQALDEIDYQGTATFEFFRWPGYDCAQGIQSSILQWRTLERIALQGYAYFECM